MSKFYILILYSLLMRIAVASASLSTFNIVVSPPRFDLRMQPGSRERITLNVRNDGTSVIELELKQFDLGMDIKGNSIALPVGQSDYSCGDWLKFSEMRFELKPDEMRQVTIDIHAPYGISGGRYAIILFETIGDIGKTNDGLLLKGRVGSLVLIDFYGRRRLEGEISSFKSEIQDDNVWFFMILKNTGDTHFRMSGSIIIKNGDRIVDRVQVDVSSGTIIPGYEREFNAIWANSRKMIPGEYMAELRVLIPGMGRYIRKETAFTIHK
ncbi:hypothetical protein JXB12_07260 [candidate division KSB1 bacterium]|nr:hypothetical protein [candidate division KSB1 bacterium]